MKLFLITVTLITAMFVTTGCKTSSVLQNNPDRESFLFLIVKNEPGVLEGLLSGCSCFEVVRFDVLDKQIGSVDFFNSQPITVTTIRLLVKVKNEPQLLSLQHQVDGMQNVVNVNFIK